MVNRFPADFGSGLEVEERLVERTPPGKEPLKPRIKMIWVFPKIGENHPKWMVYNGQPY